MIEAPVRRFLPKEFVLQTWEDVAPFFKELSDRPLDGIDALKQWLHDWSELEAVIGEDACWRQIKMTCDTTDPKLEEAFTYFCREIEPPVKQWTNSLQQKLVDCPFSDQLDATYFPFLRSVRNALALFRPENLPLEAEVSLLAQKYGVIAAKMTVTVRGKEYTLQQAAGFLQQDDRVLREEVFVKINERRLKDQDSLNELFDQLLKLRHQIARNAGFDNYRDYKFKALGRFDYTVADCEQFHQAVKEHILPLQERLLRFKKERLQVSRLRPYDVMAVPKGTKPLHPFDSGEELLEKSIAVFRQLQPFFGDCLQTMKKMGRTDLDSRKGKAPGGYNCPLPETGVPFIFMNAAGKMSDVITLMHEGGHAIHSFLCHKLPLSFFREYPMEIAELASMSMELFSMDYWGEFFKNDKELLRAKQEELERVIDVLPWIAIIDKFQHWLYTHPGHSVAERTVAWKEIQSDFTASLVDWEGLEAYRESNWQKQLHLFEVPFYYIEYGIAQLGAVAMWRQYKTNPDVAIENYKNALRLGYTKTLPELYQTAGIRFDFSPAYISELKTFLSGELSRIGM